MSSNICNLAQQLTNTLATGKPALTLRSPVLLAFRKRMAVERFFEESKAYFTHVIERGSVPGPVYLGTASFDTGTEMAGAALECHAWTEGAPLASNPFSSYWFAFQAWAAEQGLDAYWQDEHDGAHGWKALLVRPHAGVRSTEDPPVPAAWTCLSPS